MKTAWWGLSLFGYITAIFMLVLATIDAAGGIPSNLHADRGVMWLALAIASHARSRQ